ncbi:glycosyltransferase family protein [Fontivita pretiosa]|uniref:glycosyltransferase family protein n=1 Tax=Fontivita pretiosa TaxID=2989684 RepID=UPI003D17C2B4
MSCDWRELRNWQDRWEANLEALAGRDQVLTQRLYAYVPDHQWVCATATDGLRLGRALDGQIEPVPTALTPGAATQIIRKLFPAGRCTEPVMVAGLDQGWLWQALYDLPCHTPRTPGHRPPLYLLTRSLERLWVVLHLHDWRNLLADARARLFAGKDVIHQLRNAMLRDMHIPWAKLCVTIDPTIWPAGTSVDSLWQAAHQHANARMQQLTRQIEAIYAGLDVKTIVRRLRGEPMRIMGITSLYTTFLQHSMNDWLQAMHELGHDTRLIIEQADHEIANPLCFAQAVVDYRPDLILLIDHYRAEMPGLPRAIPCVMWVQDKLPTIFSSQAGAAQGPRDYCLGFGRAALGQQYGYPQSRFMPAQVGVNHRRFAPRQLGPAEIEKYGCDISFVSHASTPATALLSEQLQRADPDARKLLIDVFEQMRGVYDGGQAIPHASHIQTFIDSSLARLRLRLDETSKQSLFDFFNHRINNAMFRHQALQWAADLGLKLHLYGRGWEQHPRFARFARGVACHQTELAAIYQASRINLQITPFGAVHQRLFEGLSAGGFFLIRYCPGDIIERIYQQIYEWCVDNDVTDDATLRAKAPPTVQALLDQVRTVLGVDPFAIHSSFLDLLRLSDDGGYIRSAGSIWPEYDQVCFRSAAELRQRVEQFLNDPHRRATIAHSMRAAVIERFSYTQISRRLLDFIADDLDRNAVVQEVAA